MLFVAKKRLALGSSTDTKNNSAVTSNSVNTDRIDPEVFIKNHYSELNKRNYNLTWKELSFDFQMISTGFSGYTDWWNSVEKIQLGSTRLVSKNDSQAIVDVQLEYVMKRGGTSDDERGRIYLAWKSEKKNWEIVKKTSP